jgi:hypothetical protein
VCQKSITLLWAVAPTPRRICNLKAEQLTNKEARRMEFGATQTKHTNKEARRMEFGATQTKHTNKEARRMEFGATQTKSASADWEK